MANQPAPPPTVIVTPIKGMFSDLGMLSCLDDGILFSTNGTRLSTNQTECAFTAQWNGLNDAECWNGNFLFLLYNSVLGCPPKYCCCAYLSFYWTMSDANCWTIYTLFIALTTLWLEESAPA